jgi:CreA protein
LKRLMLSLMLLIAGVGMAHAEDPDLIFKKATVWKFLSPDDKLGTYAIDDPDVEGVTCYFTVPEKGGWKGWLGLADELPKASLSCQQVAPIKFKRKLAQGEEAFSQRRSLIFKRMQIVRGCDSKRNVLVYLVYTDRIIEGSPENSTASVPITPFGSTEPPVKCAEWISE